MTNKEFVAEYFIFQERSSCKPDVDMYTIIQQKS